MSKLTNNLKVQSPLAFSYSWVNAILPLWNGQSKSTVHGAIQAIHNQTGTPQKQVKWTDPDSWIHTRLTGVHQEQAKRIWEGSNKVVNPRHVYGCYLFVIAYELLSTDVNGIWQLTECGHKFLKKDKAFIREIDDAEGILELMTLLAERERSKRADLLPSWASFLKNNSKFGSPSTIKSTLRHRLVNLVDRQLVERDGQNYRLTTSGMNYLKASNHGVTDPKVSLVNAVGAYNQVQKQKIRNTLLEMDPYQFELLVGELLNAMGYEDVIVTKEAGDKGVDVTATVQFGITTITEVVQVKRHQASIGRPILDQLRGALPYHQAIRGTIITTGSFTKGCMEATLYPGAAPISLIDGDRLIDLMIENEVGVRAKRIELIEVDMEQFEANQSDELTEALS